MFGRRHLNRWAYGSVLLRRLAPHGTLTDRLVEIDPDVVGIGGINLYRDSPTLEVFDTPQHWRRDLLVGARLVRFVAWDFHSQPNPANRRIPPIARIVSRGPAPLAWHIQNLRSPRQWRPREFGRPSVVLAASSVSENYKTPNEANGQQPQQPPRRLGFSAAIVVGELRQH